MASTVTSSQDTGLTGGLKSGLAMSSWNMLTSGPRSTPLACAVSPRNWTIVNRSKLNFMSKDCEVTLLCPSACIGSDDTSTSWIVPSVSPRYVAVAPTVSRLMLAVNGLARMKEARAMLVFTISVGNVKEVLLISVSCIAGIVTGDRTISERAICKDLIEVESVLPVMEVSASTPCM